MTDSEAPRNVGGRPSEGTVVNVRIPAEHLTEMDRRAKEGGPSRAAQIRAFIAVGLR